MLLRYHFTDYIPLTVGEFYAEAVGCLVQGEYFQLLRCLIVFCVCDSIVLLDNMEKLRRRITAYVSRFEVSPFFLIPEKSSSLKIPSAVLPGLFCLLCASLQHKVIAA